MADVDEAAVVPLNLIHRERQIMELILHTPSPAHRVSWVLGQILEGKKIKIKETTVRVMTGIPGGR